MKALCKYLDAEKGRVVAEEWLRANNLVRQDLDDETRLIPLRTLQGALSEFIKVVPRESLVSIWRFMVVQDNLGVWMRVLRGATSPHDGFSRLDSSDSEYGRTTRWETIASSAGYWKGKVHIAHDPALEQDGLFGQMRTAQLKAIPSLFGCGPGEVITHPLATPTEGELSQEYEVRWPPPNGYRNCIIGGAVGASIGGLPLVAHPSLISSGALLLGSLMGALGGIVRTRDNIRRAETFAQSMRLQAVERSMSLKEERDQAAAGKLEGTIVAGQYRLVQQMGSGASGVIYEAVRTSDGVRVAIKLLRAVAASDATASDRLRREAEALGLMWHPNVVQVIDHGYLPDGTAYLAMELLIGDSLATRLKEKERLTTAELLPLAIQVCDALVAVHSAGVVHRDLKPSNLYLTADTENPEGGERVKLIDFGIARVEWEETRITNMGTPLGTPGYMSPEQETGGEVDGRSDIFALGAVLYECLVGEPPPPTPSGLWRSGTSASSGAIQVIDSEVHKAGKLIPPAWKELIRRAMAPSPGDRFQDARSFAMALKAVRSDSERAATASSSSSSS